MNEISVWALAEWHWQKKLSLQRTCNSATLPTRNPAWIGLR